MGRSRLLDLPTELLSQIVYSSLPLGFPSLLLTCHRIYDVGAPLLPLYHKHRNWHGYDNYHAFHVLENLMRDAPAQELDSNIALSCIQATRCHKMDLETVAKGPDVLYNFSRAMPVLFSRYRRTLQHLIELGLDNTERVLGSDAKIRALHGEGLVKLDGGNEAFGRRRIIARAISPEHHILAAAAICLFDGLESLSVDATMMQPLTQVIGRLQGQTYLQALRGLKIEGHSVSTKDLCVWLLLPRLRHIGVDDLGDHAFWRSGPGFGFFTDTFERDNFTSRVQELQVSHSTLPMDVVGRLVAKFPELLSFLWKVALGRDRIRDAGAEKDSGELVSEYIVVDGRLHTTLEVIATKSLLPNGSALTMQEIYTRPESFDFRRLTAVLERSAPNLRSLKLGWAPNEPSQLILSQHCIASFRGLGCLAHLAIDERLLLRTRSIGVDGLTLQYKFRSLVDYLPPSIERVELVMRYSCFQESMDLFKDVERRKSAFPQLRLRGIDGLDWEEKAQMQKVFGQEFQRAGIRLRLGS